MSSMSFENRWSEAEAVLVESIGCVVQRPLEGLGRRQEVTAKSQFCCFLACVDGMVEAGTLVKFVGVWAALEESFFDDGDLLPGRLRRRRGPPRCAVQITCARADRSVVAEAVEDLTTRSIVTLGPGRGCGSSVAVRFE